MNVPPDQNSKSFKNFSKEALHDLLHFDTKLIKSLKPLIFKPGYLTLQSYTSAQNKYVKPLGLFIFLNFVFFIFKSRGLFYYQLDVYDSMSFFHDRIASRLAASHLSKEIFADRFNLAMHFEQQEYIIVMIPLFACVLMLFYAGKKMSYIEHLIFSIHFYCFVVIFLMICPYVAIAIAYLISLTGNQPHFLYSEISLEIIVFIPLAIYLFFALKRVYRQNIIVTFLKSVTLSCVFFILIIFVYRTILFYIVLHSISE